MKTIQVPSFGTERVVHFYNSAHFYFREMSPQLFILMHQSSTDVILHSCMQVFSGFFVKKNM